MIIDTSLTRNATRLDDLKEQALQALCRDRASHVVLDVEGLIDADACCKAMQQMQRPTLLSKLMARLAETQLDHLSFKNTASLYKNFSPWHSWVASLLQEVVQQDGKTHESDRMLILDDSTVAWHTDYSYLTSVLTVYGPTTRYAPQMTTPSFIVPFIIRGTEPVGIIKEVPPGKMIVFNGAQRATKTTPALWHSGPKPEGQRLTLVVQNTSPVVVAKGACATGPQPRNL